MKSQQYDYMSLIKTYIATQRRSHIHPDFDNYYRGLLAVLEQGFKVTLSLDGITNSAFYFSPFYALPELPIEPND